MTTNGSAGAAGDRARLHRVYLVGFMGAGKTSVGECLARTLGYSFLDLDREVERISGRSIPFIFDEEGESGFRRIEAASLREISAQEQIVVACGGGTLTTDECLRLIRRRGISVWLDAPLDLMLSRCAEGGHRPVLSGRPEMAGLLESRLPAYKEAEIHVDAAAGTPSDLALRIASDLSDLASRFQ